MHIEKRRPTYSKQEIGQKGVTIALDYYRTILNIPLDIKIDEVVRIGSRDAFNPINKTITFTPESLTQGKVNILAVFEETTHMVHSLVNDGLNLKRMQLLDEMKKIDDPTIRWEFFLNFMWYRNIVEFIGKIGSFSCLNDYEVETQLALNSNMFGRFFYDDEILNNGQKCSQIKFHDNQAYSGDWEYYWAHSISLYYWQRYQSSNMTRLLTENIDSLPLEIAEAVTTNTEFNVHDFSTSFETKLKNVEQSGFWRYGIQRISMGAA